MDFFQAQHSLTTIEWILRSAVAYLFLVAVARMFGQRAISQLRLIDFVLALIIGNIIANPLADHEVSLNGSLITTLALVLFYIGTTYGTLKWNTFNKLVTGSPIPVIRNGEIIYNGMKKARIPMDLLLEELRRLQVKSVENIGLATWEASGQLSVFLKPEFEPVTAGALQLTVQPFDLPRTIIKEGKLLKEELLAVGKREGWVKAELNARFHTELEDVLLATIDGKDQLQVFYYR
ncbi:DUF421 domain-containing protein [Halobacillus litoralis]|uniref:DUF421 domain-containing protein n=1 Tax=Halobacillus litoralis TaxID=45668 RepID=A0A410MC38_9BACI|nr:DUF421 domain-containing protein [Halobacillus litoralis]QAS52291.1 hypothetical protein HLI_08625 [Halobacillus litoralis]